MQPMAREGGSVSQTVPPGSTLSTRRSRCSPSMPWKYQYGTPLIAVTSAVVRTHHLAAIAGAAAGQRMRLHAVTTT